ncbi:MAG: hypothetical protein J3R72DRAFT_422014 [Linnemannia gamsii]|nr:MAG: hypothetical protein J3R72DRAFT_422014 [Linnemannia gamsii]
MIVVGKQQRIRVYEQLTKLVKLKELVIGYENRTPVFPLDRRFGADGQEYLCHGGPIFDTLELSLESGLEQLSTLKDLEVFGFECANHRIGKRGLEWMARAWPQLRMEYDCHKDELREYFQALQPDVVHEG